MLWNGALSRGCDRKIQGYPQSWIDRNRKALVPRGREKKHRETLLSLLSSLIVPYKPIPRSPPSSFRRVRVRVCSAWRDPAFRSSIPTRSFAHLQPEPARNQRRQLSSDRSARRGRRISPLIYRDIDPTYTANTFVYESFVRGSQHATWRARSLGLFNL